MIPRCLMVTEFFLENNATASRMKTLVALMNKQNLCASNFMKPTNESDAVISNIAGVLGDWM